MAFPTLPPYSVRNPITRERLIVQRRAHDADRIEKWSGHSRYFTTSDNRSNKENAWSSQKSYQNRYWYYYYMRYYYFVLQYERIPERNTARNQGGEVKREKRETLWIVTSRKRSTRGKTISPYIIY